MDVLTILILPAHKYEICFLLCLLNISFMCALNVFIHISFNTLFKYISKYFMFSCNYKWIICISVICFGVWKGNWVLYIQIQYTKCMLFFYRIDNPSPNKIVFYLGSFLSVSFKTLQSPEYIPREIYNSLVLGFISASQSIQYGWSFELP